MATTLGMVAYPGSGDGTPEYLDEGGKSYVRDVFPAPPPRDFVPRDRPDLRAQGHSTAANYRCERRKCCC